MTKVSVKDRVLEWLGNLLDKILMKLAGMGARAPWAGRLLEGLLLGGICIALVWFFIRIERSARVRLIPDVEPGPGAPSAREWQLWIKDAQTRPQAVSGGRPFILSTGPRFRGWSRGVCGPPTARAHRGNISDCWRQ